MHVPKLPKKALLLAVLTVLGLTAIPTVNALGDWGPDRPTFTWANPATYVTFNSITDNPTAGDERTFYNAYDTAAGSSGASHTINVTDNEEVTLRVYYHNNAAANLNLVATNTRVKMVLPTTAAASQSSVAYISADNANPGSVWDTTHLNSDSPFTLEYETGSARLYNNVFNGAPLSDSIVSGSGALIGYDQMDGKVPGCANFSGWVTIKVKVHKQTPPPTPAYTCDLLNIAADNESRKVTISDFNTTASGGATFKNAVIDWGDNSAQLTSANVVGQTHQYSADGTYTITATAHFDVNGQDKTATSTACAKQVTFKSKTPPVVTPPTAPPTVTTTVTRPTTLVNTGAGSIVGLFAGATIAGTFGYRWYLGRRLSSQ